MAKSKSDEVQPDVQPLIRCITQVCVKHTGTLLPPGSVVDVAPQMLAERPWAFRPVADVEREAEAQSPDARAAQAAAIAQIGADAHAQRRRGARAWSDLAAQAAAVVARRQFEDAAVAEGRARAIAAGDLTGFALPRPIVDAVPAIQIAPQEQDRPQDMRDAMRQAMATSRRILSERADQVLIQRAIKGAA